jgi:hypothetical protein
MRHDDRTMLAAALKAVVIYPVAIQERFNSFDVVVTAHDAPRRSAVRSRRV